MKKIMMMMTTVALMMNLSTSAWSANVGDVNNDNKVDVEDVNSIISAILNTSSNDEQKAKSDVTGDGRIDIEDVNRVINIILELEIQVKDGIISSVYANENDIHFEFNLNEVANIGTITVYNVIFTIGDRQSPAMTIRIPDAKFTRNGNTITFNDTDIAPEMKRGSGFVPMGDPLYNVTDLISVLNLVDKTFSISFKCHGGEFSDNGSITFEQ
ncbi:MAG: dockerin type I repeat-containing protein [Muribaculaceae bacterium]|nr:dockerin type I repeat-containing protein [Muribaculaceae bacterium]